ncbi:PIR protein [Plasmodium vivax]|uniref:VIR protein n=1 Tax=Plasmodium vivax TaxID=5855 RepID=A0A565A6Z7_PLAVI|nr:PIR protein [Plasmodium vivax]
MIKYSIIHFFSIFNDFLHINYGRYSRVILKLIDTLKYYSNENICNLVYTNIDDDVFKKIKLIFDFTEDYENYEIDLAKPNRWCNEKYHSYLTTYVNTYKELYSKCIVEQQKDMYCQAFKKYYNDEKRINLYTWSCTLKKSTKAPPLVVESGKSAHVEQLGGISDRGSQSELSQPTIKAENQQDAEQPVQDHNFNGGISETIITEHPSDDKSTSITSKSITGGLSVAGILVPSYLMYNYTPAGIWISKLLGRNKGPNFNSYANQELMPNLSMPGDLYSERSRYNISYRPE